MCIRDRYWHHQSCRGHSDKSSRKAPCHSIRSITKRQDVYKRQAGNHTITSGSGVIINDPTAASYDNFKNLTINGGVWKNSSSSGLKGTMMRISYASDISINDATVYCNYTGHGIELIACNGVSINGCKLIPQGKCCLLYTSLLHIF